MGCSLSASPRILLALVVATVALLFLAGCASFAPTAPTPTGGRPAPSRPPRRIEATATPDPDAPRAWMGAIFGPDSKHLRTLFHAPSDEVRALVLAVIPDQPADRAGLLVGDWVVAVNGKAARSNTDVVSPVRSSSPGTVFRLRVVRDGQERELSVRVEARPGDADQRFFEHLTDRIRTNSQDMVAYLLRADMWPSDKVEESLADYNRIIALAPDLEIAYTQRARLLLGTGEVEGAATDASRALALDPSRREAYMVRATAYASLGRNDEAIADTTRALEMTQEPLAYALRGQAYLQRARQGDLPSAIEDETQALILLPLYPFPYYVRGLAYAQLGKVNQAIFDLKQHIYLAPFSQSAAAARSRLQQLTWH
ncbi:MAG: PDZ domain-containing protein [Anaerolineae bacterium]|nr:PDZ domain-containing protein [Anaerolineae bacterium]